MSLPSRMAVLNYMNEHDSVNVKSVMEALKPFYGNEKQFNENLYLEHFMALEANGLVELASYNLDDKENLIMNYRINDDGREAVEKYVDKKYRN
ncbi:hypothetical protein [Companilactobacillus suantsaicola]|nr:hypothetical protein [Companilactobacillus suantsaicola]